MQRGGEDGIIQKWAALAGAEPDARRRGDYGGLAIVYAEKGDCHAAWKKALDRWNVIQSPQVFEWQAQALERGHDEGLDEGRIQKAKQLLQEILRAKFATIPGDLVAAIANSVEEATLDRWAILAVRADSLDAFRHQAGV